MFTECESTKSTTLVLRGGAAQYLGDEDPAERGAAGAGGTGEGRGGRGHGGAGVPRHPGDGHLFALSVQVRQRAGDSLPA